MHHVLILGAGTMGRVHAEAYAEMDNVQVVGIVDRDSEKAGQLASPLGAPVFTSVDEALVTLEHFTVVDICLPTFLHKKNVLRFAEIGIDIICEKPIARNLEDAREIIDFCKEKDVKLFVGHVVRFFPEYELAKQRIDEGAIGKPAVARTFRGGIFPKGWNDWYADFNQSGGLVLDMIIHDFDYLRWMFGEVERVYAKSLLGRNYLQVDYALVTLRFKSGVIAHVEGSWAHEGFTTKYEIAGKTGIIDYDSSKETPLLLKSKKAANGIGGVAVPESPLIKNPYYLELEHFLSCIEREMEPKVTAEDAYKAVEIAVAALESIQSGKPVTMNSDMIHQQV
ncbi:Gfo/Idh/MocA family protein [Bacillus sp. Marseille-Q3570]|uniref:Gfo/Idh/MocA family protein n=1 Tax=Bacillus sp. Marseille-Q3570 TaxID=2963522 RepID=UPI0021B70F98|nr:Gfo/Idh/MocA family oxidoreductase [Bacillus sp. Marseille-Q3570]